MSGGDLLEHALAYAAAGQPVQPAHPQTKAPRQKGAPKSASTDPDTIRAWWKRWPDAIIGGAVPAGCVTLDVDPRHNGDKVWRALEAAHGPVPVSHLLVSGRGDRGFHARFQWPHDFTPSTDRLVDFARAHEIAYVNANGIASCGIDILRPDWRHSVLPPSPHPETGDPYQWIEQGDPGPMPDWLVELLRPYPEPPPRSPQSASLDGDSIADWYSQTATWESILRGWTLDPRSGDGESDGSLWKHPSATAAHSASVRHGCLFVYSDNTPFTTTQQGVRNGYTKFRAYAVMEHGGDMSAAGRAARELRNGPSPVYDLRSASTRPPANVDPATGEIVRAGLTEEFWNARPELDHIRRAARSAMVSPDALLGAVLARLAAFTPPSRAVPAVIGDTVTLAMLVALIGETGDGKTASSNGARRLLPNVPPGIFAGSLGSGEGLVEAFMENVSETDADGKKRTVKRQTRHGALFALDEGSVLAEIGSRRGATILPTLCSAWIGAEIGQANASGETKRHLPFGSYTIGLVSLWQPHAAARLLDDAEGGTPGRFLFLPTDDPAAPDDVPDWPGSLEWSPPPRCAFGDELELPEEIVRRIRDHRRAVLRREITVPALDKHAHLLTAKVAGLLATLAGRRTVTLDDWALAETVMRVSQRTRATVVEAARLAAVKAEDAAHGRAARREIAVGNAVRDNAIRLMATAIARRAERLGRPITQREATQATKSDHRKHATPADAIDFGVDRGWLVVDGDHYRLGDSRPA